MKNPLEIADIYHACQMVGGFFGARLKAFHDYLDFSAVHRIFDIGAVQATSSNIFPKKLITSDLISINAILNQPIAGLAVVAALWSALLIDQRRMILGNRTLFS